MGSSLLLQASQESRKSSAGPLAIGIVGLEAHTDGLADHRGRKRWILFTLGFTHWACRAGSHPQHVDWSRRPQGARTVRLMVSQITGGTHGWSRRPDHREHALPGSWSRRPQGAHTDGLAGHRGAHVAWDRIPSASRGLADHRMNALLGLWSRRPQGLPTLGFAHLVCCIGARWLF
jgi:hypothetical protein